jgi:hypothetical protein
MQQLYEALLTREQDRLRELVENLCRAEGDREALDYVLKFAVLAFSPTLHSRGAVYASLAALDLLDGLPNPSGVIVECAAYAAETRLPWSESPITDPPAVEGIDAANPRHLDEAIRRRDLRAAERWLAAAILEDAPAVEFFDAAARFAGEEGYGFTTATAAWRIAEHAPAARFVSLRTALLEWVRVRDGAGARRVDATAVAPRKVIDLYVMQQGRIELFTPLLVLDAALTAEAVTGKRDRYRPVVDRYALPVEWRHGAAPECDWSMEDLAYRYSRDYAAFLMSVPISHRLSRELPDSGAERIPSAAQHNLEYAETFEEWSFA